MFDGHIYYISGWGSNPHVVRWDPTKDKATMEWDVTVRNQSWGSDWTHMGGVAIDEDYVYVAEARDTTNDNSEICVLRKSNGTLVACQSGMMPGYRMTGGLVVANSHIYVPDDDNGLGGCIPSLIPPQDRCSVLWCIPSTPLPGSAPHSLTASITMLPHTTATPPTAIVFPTATPSWRVRRTPIIM